MKLRSLREAKGLTTKYVAEQLGIKPQSLTKKERTNKFNVLQLAKLCELYGVKIKDIDI